MKRKVILSVFLMLPVLICMGLIFQFSAQDSGYSNLLSRNFTEKIAELLFQNFIYMNEDIQNTIIYELNLFIRKAAHFFVFFVMSIFIYAEIVIWLKKYFLCGIISTIICMIYAIADEFHQKFTPGRTPLIKDVIIDTSGAVLGAIVCFVIISLIFHIQAIMRRNNSFQPSASLSDS